MSESTYLLPGALGFSVTVTVNTDEAERMLEDVDKKANDLRPLWTKLANWMRASFARNFWEGGRPDRWAPLKPSTIMAKAMDEHVTYNNPMARMRIRRLTQLTPQGVPARSIHNILIAGGQLRDSAVQKNKDHVELVSKDRLEIGSKHWLSEIHQMGTQPYTIRPKRGRFLRFMGQHGMVVARSVHHPGLPARPFIIAQPEDIDYAADMAQEHICG